MASLSPRTELEVFSLNCTRAHSDGVTQQNNRFLDQYPPLPGNQIIVCQGYGYGDVVHDIVLKSRSGDVMALGNAPSTSTDAGEQREHHMTVALQQPPRVQLLRPGGGAICERLSELHLAGGAC